MTHPKTQHYVPQFLLRGFTGRKKRLHVFDKLTGKAFTTAPTNVAAENGFYDLELDVGTVTLEPRLSHLESHAAAVIDKIRKTESLADLGASERGTLAIFAAVQHLRTAHFRAQVADMDRQMAAWLEGMGIDPDNVRGYRPFKSENDVKGFTMAMLINAAQEIAEHLINKDWILTRAPKGNPFIIGDHPVTLSNERDLGLYGNIGFAVPGIEIYLPITSRLALYFTCTTNGDKFRDAWRQLERLRGMAPTSGEVERLRVRLGPMARAINEGGLLDASPANVLRHNSLQISYAERWIYSSTDDFSLVQRMIKDHPQLKHGRRGLVGWPSMRAVDDDGEAGPDGSAQSAR